MTDFSTIFDETQHDLRTSWKSLALTDISYKIIAFIVLTPLVGLLLRTLLAASGQAVLADQDILFFFLGPVGWVCFVAVGAVWLGIVALEQSALLAILAPRGQERVAPWSALRYTSTIAWPIIQVTTRLVALTLLTVAPFLLVAGLIYLILPYRV